MWALGIDFSKKMVCVAQKITVCLHEMQKQVYKKVLKIILKCTEPLKLDLIIKPPIVPVSALIFTTELLWTFLLQNTTLISANVSILSSNRNVLNF